MPVQISHGGSQGFKSPHLHPQHRRSERRRRQAGGAHCMLRPRCGRERTSQSSQGGSQRPGESTLGLPRWPRSVVATSLRTPARLPTGDPHAHPAHPGRSRSRPSHCSTTSTTTARSNPTPRGCLPHRRPPRPPGRTQRTRERMDTGRPRRTPDAWTLRCPHRTLDSGRVNEHWGSPDFSEGCLPGVGR
jgi:hypothetical protein